jgi:hypothetical protein
MTQDMMNAGRDVGGEDKNASNYFSFWGLKVQYAPYPEPTNIASNNNEVGR